jgi:c-di-GMP-binding flagellar brake protein YcgR
MFEGTTSWWRRLMKRQSEDAPSAAPPRDERRVWVRHPCDRVTQYAPDPDEPPQSAHILDISAGGARIVVAEEHEPGALISIELPGADGKTMCAALACVVHVRQFAEAEWVLGCNFSKELDEEQLRAFGVRTGATGATDKRSWPRFTANLTATVQLTNSYDLTRWPAKVLNLSVGGIALTVERDIPNGTMLTADLVGANGETLETILICVVHITTQEDGMQWLGCNFIRELDENDLRRLLS